MKYKLSTLLPALLLLIQTVFLIGCNVQKPAELSYDDHSELSSEGSRHSFHFVLNNEKMNTVQSKSSMTRFAYQDNYYFIQNGALYKYDLVIDATLPACTDPGCTHSTADCISNRLPGNKEGESAGILLFVHDHVIYTQRGNVIYAYNESNSKTEMFLDCEPYGVLLTAYPNDDALLLQIRVITTDESGKTVGKTTLYRVGVKDKKVNEITAFDQNDTQLLFAVDKKCFFIENNRSLFELDLTNGARTDLIKHDFLWKVAVSEGKVLFSYIAQKTEIGYFYSCAVDALDLATEKITHVCDDPIVQYEVTDEYIYYIPRVDENEYYALWRIDHEGKNKEKVLTFGNIAYTDFGFEFFLIEGDYLLAFDGSDYCYDLTTGAWTVIGTDQWNEP